MLGKDDSGWATGNLGLSTFDQCGVLFMIPYYNYWGKSRPDMHHFLVFHCLDVAAITWQLLTVNGKFSFILSKRCGLPVETIRYLVVFSMMLHDLGKFSKRFQALNPVLFQNSFPGTSIREYEIRHDSMGFLLWRGDDNGDFLGLKLLLAEKNPALAGILDCIIKSSFGHHGIPPLESKGNLPLRASLFFDEVDRAAARTFVEDAMALLGNTPELPMDIKTIKKALRAISWQIAGLGILADWVGSNSEFFPYCSAPVELSEYWEKKALLQAGKAIEALQLTNVTPSRYRGITTLFPFIAVPTPLQRLAETMLLLPGPKLFIIEDVTGAGKTEAAMILAARIMANGDADGLYVGLPTMATANAMYGRMQKAYRQLFEGTANPSLILAHGARHLSVDFTKTVAVSQQDSDRPYGTEETASAYCNEWFADNRKKALLANVGVGTIDQALMGILPARHQALRLFGLQRKVLIVDEVHAYDPYMEKLLGVLLEAHSQSGGSAILLSATIPQKKRAELIQAFQNGLGGDPASELANSALPFPLLTQVGGDSPPEHTAVATRKTVARQIGVNFHNTYQAALSAVVDAARQGKSVCWIRNTVKDARKSFYDLSKSGLERIDLFHSRFAMIDRNRIEKGTLANFGKTSGPLERQGRVLIATQVVEQSLDLDFDELISDLAPIDLLIQRAGRLRRHVRDANGNVKPDSESLDDRGMPILQVFCPEFSEDADERWLQGDFLGTLAVYQDIGVLWRTLRVLREKQGWQMPEDGRALIEAVYGEGSSYDVPEGLVNKVCMAIGKDSAKVGMAHLNALLLEKGYCRNAVRTEQWNEEDKIPTRLSEDNEEIVLVVLKDGELRPYADVDEFAWDWSTLSVSFGDWKRAAYVLAPVAQVLEEVLKIKYPRLKYCQIVQVQCHASAALSATASISEVYDPRLGWGVGLSKEA